MLKLFGTLFLIMLVLYGAEQAGWLTAEQAQFVPQLEAALPEALHVALPFPHEPMDTTRSFTERVSDPE